MLYYIYYIDPRMAGQLSPMCYCLQRPVLLGQEKEKKSRKTNNTAQPPAAAAGREENEK